MTTNSLGGNMPQERLDKIKAAWLNRYGAPESDWDVFTQQTQALPGVETFDDPDNQAVTLCPTAEILSMRYTARAKHHFRLARSFGHTPKGFSHYNDGLFYTKLAHQENERHNRIIRMIRGGV